MSNDDLASLELAEDKGVIRPSLIAIGLIAAGLAMGMLNDQPDRPTNRPTFTVSDRTG